MKIIVTADLHAEFLKQKVLEKFAKKIAEQKPDILVAAGDIGVGKHWSRALIALRDVAPVRCVIGGNHDYYICDYDFEGRRVHRTPSMKFETQLPRESRECGWDWVEDSVVRLGQDGRVAVVCSCAWYDYEMSGPDVAAARCAKEAYHSDARFIEGYDPEWNDLTFCAARRESILRRLRECEADSSIDSVVLITHVPVFPEQRVPMPGDLPALDGCFYGISIGREILAGGFRKLTKVISGHTHRGMSGTLERGGMPPLHLEVVPADYYKPGFVEIHVGSGVPEAVAPALPTDGETEVTLPNDSGSPETGRG